MKRYDHIMKLKMLLVFISLFVINCKLDKENGATTSKEANPAVMNSLTNSTWINTSFLSCIKSKLPCNCQQPNEITIVHFDENLVKVYGDSYGYEELYLKTNNNKEYEVFTHEGASDPLFTISYEDNVLSLKQDAYEIRLVNLEITESLEADENLLGQLNLYFLKDILKKRNFDIADQLMFDKNVTLYCNQENGYTNLISKQGDCNFTYLVENNDTTFYIYKLVNSCEGKTISQDIKKELIFQIE